VVAVGAVSPSSSYDAFVSYSHAADGRLAPALQAGLQSLAKPWHRGRTLRPRLVAAVQATRTVVDQPATTRHVR
jgi:hypothetical protein